MLNRPSCVCGQARPWQAAFQAPCIKCFGIETSHLPALCIMTWTKESSGHRLRARSSAFIGANGAAEDFDHSLRPCPKAICYPQQWVAPVTRLWCTEGAHRRHMFNDTLHQLHAAVSVNFTPDEQQRKDAHGCRNPDCPSAQAAHSTLLAHAILTPPVHPGTVNDNYIYPSTTIRNAYGAC